MIRLATVFSGIGAIEHALDRMGIKHKIEEEINLLIKNKIY